MIIDYANKYWLAADGSVYSSSRDLKTTTSDAAYIADIVTRQPLPWPVDASDTQTDAALYALLKPYGFGGALAPAPTQAQLIESLIDAAVSVCSEITAQVVPDQTHQVAYANALAVVGPSATVPTSDPAKTAFANMANAFGFGSNLQGLASLAVAVGSASLNLSAILGTLEGAAKSATTSTALGAALSAFEASIQSFVTTLNAAGLTITVETPAPIIIAGISS